MIALHPGVSRAARGPLPAGAAALPSARRANWPLFLAFNGLLLALLGVGIGTHPQQLATLAVYVQLLGLLCSLPLCWSASLRGPMALLLLLQGVLFVHFGLRDVIGLLAGFPFPARPHGLFSGGEIAALLTALSVLLGYALVTALAPGRNATTLASDWTPSGVRWLGIACWLIGFVINAQHLFTVADLQTGIVDDNPFAGVLSLLRFLQPVGSALLVYQVVARRDRAMLPVLVLSFALDIVLGYLGDSKEVAFRGVFLLLIGHLLLRDRIPLVRGLVLVVLAGASFSYFAAWRDTLAMTGTTRVEAVRDLDSILGGIAEEMSPAERVTRGLDYFTERMSLKGNLDLIVARTGDTVAFQEGSTLVGVFYTFLPRYLFPDKPDTSTGRLFNAQFGVSSVATTYISQGINGELYWNFGWTGLILGMVAVGALLAHVNHVLDLGLRTNAPRFLFLIVTAYLLCVRFEGNVSTEYTYWLRALALLALLHLAMPKLRAVLAPQQDSAAGPGAASPLRVRWVPLQSNVDLPSARGDVPSARVDVPSARGEEPATP